MEKINIHAILEEIHIHFFTNSQTIARQELGDDTFFPDSTVFYVKGKN
tara:strand:- start:2 stop:145 length:144 start_codon:yes stop_codon:yes gene_type:complete